MGRDSQQGREVALEGTIPGGEKAQGWGSLQGWDRGKARGVHEEAASASFLYLNVNLVKLGGTDYGSWNCVPSSGLPAFVLPRAEANTFQLPKLTSVLHPQHA